MSFEAMQNAIAAKLDREAPDVERRKTEIKERLFGPMEERADVIELDKAVALRDSDPDSYATLPAELRRRAGDWAEWRKTHPKTTTGGEA
ncbi:hypothetical protein ACIBBG_26815 [Micromonospora chersina]|uniref:hypothetical protein n=1 Tax=Micromonospora chersina TaxID=47854 RepID=UPI00378988BF